MQRPKILIAGIQSPDNQFVRAIEKYGMEPIHFGPNNGNGKQFPTDADAAICVTSFTSHDYFWRVKDTYKEMGKKVFFANQGFSEIKESFEAYFLSELKLKLEPMKWMCRFHYLLGHFYKIGDRFKINEFEVRIQRFYSSYPESHFRNFLNFASKEGSLQRGEKRGRYTYGGMSPKRSQLFSSRYGVAVVSDWLQKESEPQVIAPTVEVVPSVTAPEVVVAEPVAQANKPDETVALLLDCMTELEKKVDSMNKRMDQILSIFNPALFNKTQ